MNSDRNILDHLQRGRYAVVQTINDGDCLFAAFAISRHKKIYTHAEQRVRAARYRELVTRAMTTDPAFIAWWNNTYVPFTGGVPINVEFQRQIRGRFARRSAQRREDVERAFRGDLSAYAAVMRTPKTWAGTPELHMLAQLYSATIVVLCSNDDGYYVYQKIVPLDGAPSTETIFVYYNGINHFSGFLSERRRRK